MSFGEFLIPVIGSDGEPRFMERVSKFMEGLDVAGTLFFCSPDPKDMLMISADGFIAGLGASIINSIEQTNEEIWTKIVLMAQEYPQFILERETGSVDTLVAERAAISDLVVVSGKSAAGKSTVSAAFDESLLRARIPALIIKTNSALTHDNIAIAWDGSPQASRAVKAAMPILKAAKYITILQVGGEAEVASSIISSPETLKNVLQKHDINADILSHEQPTKSVGDTLLSLCEKIGADLLVTGAYGQSRAREFVFGGTTRTLLRADTGPNLIVCH